MSGGGLPPTAKKVLSSQGGEVKLLVTLKRTPQRDARIRISEAGDSLDLDNVQFEVNPFDELAVEEALRIREAGGEVEVVVVTVGGEECQQQLISALAMGADRLPLSPGGRSRTWGSRGSWPLMTNAGRGRR